MSIQSRCRALVACCGLLLIASPARADLIISVLESGSDVLVNYSGTLDVTGLSIAGGGPTNVSRFNIIGGGGSTLENTFSGQAIRTYSSPFSSTPGTFYSGSGPTVANSSSGSYLYLATGGANPLRVRTADIVSNIWTGSGAMTFNSKTFATLGLTQGTYTWTINNTAANHITMTIGAAPEPSSLVLVSLGGLALLRRKRRRRSES